MNNLKIKAPATVANLGCGFDIMGFALDLTADELIIRKNSLKSLRIIKLSGYGNLPDDPEKNVATVAIKAMLKKLRSNQGFDIEINKKTKPGSGIGSSAASAAGAVVGVNKLLGDPFTRKELIPFAMKGEKAASGSEHADNVAPAILGGITLVRSNLPLDVIQLPVPNDLYCVLLHPQIEIKTKDARDILSPEVDLKLAVKQWGNVAGLISGLYTSDYALISRSLTDYIIEPQRSTLIKGYNDLKQVALNAGALGCSISGSGPSIFALAKNLDTAEKVHEAMQKQYSKENIEFNIYLRSINQQGVNIFQ